MELQHSANPLLEDILITSRGHNVNQLSVFQAQQCRLNKTVLIQNEKVTNIQFKKICNK